MMAHILILRGVSHENFIRWSTPVKTNSALVLRLEENEISLEDIKSMFRTRKRLFRFTILQLILFGSAELVPPRIISVEYRLCEKMRRTIFYGKFFAHFLVSRMNLGITELIIESQQLAPAEDACRRVLFLYTVFWFWKVLYPVFNRKISSYWKTLSLKIEGRNEKDLNPCAWIRVLESIPSSVPRFQI